MRIVAGLSLKNLKPRVWDPDEPYYLPDLDGVMLSYADFHRMQARRMAATTAGLHAYLGVRNNVQVFLDNGAFYFLRKDGALPLADYEAFVASARPDWYPIPRDYIPSPSMPSDEQFAYLEQTMAVNRAYAHDGFVPVIHAGLLVREYLSAFIADERLARKEAVGIGGLVPSLLRAPRALPYRDVLEGLIQVRDALPNVKLHLFGVGGTATLHLAALLGADSVDSSGWRNRAARGIVQLPGRGDRMVAELGRWKGREPDVEEWKLLETCPCPICRRDGISGLRSSKLAGFCHRATHNLWTLLEEARLIDEQLAAGTYHEWYPTHVSNSTYRPLIDALVQELHEHDGCREVRP